MSEAAFDGDTIGSTVGPAGKPLGMRLLTVFWGVVLLAIGGIGVTLQVLGPPRPSEASHAMAADKHPPGVEQHPGAAPAITAVEPKPAREAIASAPKPAAPEALAPDSSIRAPDAALLEGTISGSLPRIAADGRTPRQVYAASFDPTERRPRIAILLGGIGESESGTEEATRTLPAAMSFAVSPYTMRPDRLLDGIRARGHEMLVGLPMEPQNYPVNDEGSYALLTGAPAEQNEQRLDWTLSRLQGYIGVTNALDGLRGERFSASTLQIGAVLRAIAARGLLYVDAAPALSHLPGDLPSQAARGVDVVIDEPAVRTEIDLKLAQLEQVATARGAALGLAGLPRPVTLNRLAAWASSLDQRGFALVPVSAIMTSAPKPTATTAGQSTTGVH